MRASVEARKETQVCWLWPPLAVGGCKGPRGWWKASARSTRGRATRAKNTWQGYIDTHHLCHILNHHRRRHHRHTNRSPDIVSANSSSRPSACMDRRIRFANNNDEMFIIIRLNRVAFLLIFFFGFIYGIFALIWYSLLLGSETLKSTLFKSKGN